MATLRPVPLKKLRQNRPGTTGEVQFDLTAVSPFLPEPGNESGRWAFARCSCVWLQSSSNRRSRLDRVTEQVSRGNCRSRKVTHYR